MIRKELLRLVVRDQQTELLLKPQLVQREYTQEIPLESAVAHIVKGVRRCGKSTLLKQLMCARFASDVFYLNFDDERLMDFETGDFQGLMEVFIEILGTRRIVLFDEIQNIRGWELFVNRLLREDYKVFLTGSNADLLSKELGTHLTGRHLDYELYPFSFREYLSFASPGFDPTTIHSTPEKAKMIELFRIYLLGGGMPEATIGKNPAVLGQIVEDILQKDIIRRYKIRKLAELQSIIRFLIWNAGRRITYKSIADNFSMKSISTVQKYVRYAEEACLFFTVNRFERKTKQFDKNPKKIYCVDNGFVIRYAQTSNPSYGALLENLVAIELSRRGLKFFYYSNKDDSETDFVVVAEEGNQLRISEVIQACFDPHEPETAEREETALLKTLNETGLKEGIILTFEYEGEKIVKGKKITYLPVWKWLLARSEE